MKSTLLFIEPLDVLFLRGNKLFGDPGSYGESLIFPRPSVVAGALRSGLIANRNYDTLEFANGKITSDSELGTPDKPGTFVLERLNLAKRCQIEDSFTYTLLYPLPCDLAARSLGGTGRDEIEICQIKPESLQSGSQDLPGILTSNASTSLPVLAENTRSKYLPHSHLYLTDEGWNDHLRGKQVVPENHLVRLDDLQKTEDRIGIGLDATRGSVDENKGKLFTMQAVSLRKREHRSTQDYDVGLIAEVSGATFPDLMTIRLGGDGRGALVTRINQDENHRDSEESMFELISKERRCRLILTSPGIFAEGWNFTSRGNPSEAEQELFDGVSAKIQCAVIHRHEIISGFDISKWQPKPAQRAVPAGMVYWLTELNASAESLAAFVKEGLWQSANRDSARRAEGFNRFELGIYGED